MRHVASYPVPRSQALSSKAYQSLAKASKTGQLVYIESSILPSFETGNWKMIRSLEVEAQGLRKSCQWKVKGKSMNKKDGTSRDRGKV